MAKKEETYESMVNRLEKIISEMDNNDISLEQSMKNYEEGIKISNKLFTILNKAEGKIKILNQGDGSAYPSEEEFLSKEE